MWFLNSLLVGLEWANIKPVARDVRLFVWLICLLLPVATQIGILATMRRHHKRVQVHLRETRLVQRQLREVKLAKSISVIVGGYINLNFPTLFVKFYRQIDLRENSHNSWTETLALLNSSSNPFISCWKNQQIRRKVKALLKKRYFITN